jgi:hydroxymethylpyrimidine/phosphomethylpyrimidine kinase
MDKNGATLGTGCFFTEIASPAVMSRLKGSRNLIDASIQSRKRIRAALRRNIRLNSHSDPHTIVDCQR